MAAARRGSMLFGRLLGVIALTIASFIAAIVASANPASAAGEEGCSYGANGPLANTLCWIDLTGFSQATASLPAGQAFSITLDGGYTVAFTAHYTGDRPIIVSAFPTWTDGSPNTQCCADFGNRVYKNVAGQPALYQVIGNGTTLSTVSFTGIVVKDSGGNVVHGWRMVGADAEATYATESLQFSSDVPIFKVADHYPVENANGCQRNVTGLGTTNVSCTGTFDPTAYGTLLVGADEPTVFTQTMNAEGNNSARQGVAFAFQSAKITGAVAVAGRVAAGDTFDVTATSPEAAIVGTATTGAADTATTGELTVLPRVDGSSYTLTATGSNLDAYTHVWTCTNNGEPGEVTGADALSLLVEPAAGDSIACTITFTPGAPAPAAIALTKTASTGLVSAAGAGVTYSFLVTNTGGQALAGVGIAEAAFTGTGALSAVACPATDLAAGASMTCTATYTVTAADIARGSIVNTAAAYGAVVGAATVVSDPSSVTVAVAPQLAATGTSNAVPLALAGGCLLVAGALLLTVASVRRRV